jgi:hypothetical protein
VGGDTIMPRGKGKRVKVKKEVKREIVESSPVGKIPYCKVCGVPAGKVLDYGLEGEYYWFTRECTVCGNAVKYYCRELGDEPIAHPPHKKGMADHKVKDKVEKKVLKRVSAPKHKVEDPEIFEIDI